MEVTGSPTTRQLRRVLLTVDQHCAALAAAWFADDGIALQTKVNRADAPSTTVSSALYNSIAI